tara:strand:+ start:1338 stop:1553 length:216 start_codon:yes stop_codon:yes gene_type:complete
MTPEEALTEIKERLVITGVVATEEAAQSFIDSRGSEWEITEDIISKIEDMGDRVVDVYMLALDDEMRPLDA